MLEARRFSFMAVLVLPGLLRFRWLNCKSLWPMSVTYHQQNSKRCRAGFNVITTCSASNIDRVKALGATEAFDYKDPSCGEKIREYTKDSLKKIFDTISQGSSVNMCIAAASSSGAAVSTTLPWPEDRERKDEIEARMLFTLGIFGVPTGYGQNIIPANPEDYEYSKKLYAVAEKLLHDGKLKVHPPKLCKPGLEGVFDAIEQGKTGKASGVKLIVKL